MDDRKEITRFALGMLAVLMERNGLTEFEVTSAELAEKPRALLFSVRADGEVFRFERTDISPEEASAWKREAEVRGGSVTQITKPGDTKIEDLRRWD